MTISSRTPEGLPQKCPICGAEFVLEPSALTNDAPCPNCGQLLWWFQERLPVIISLDALRPDTAFSDLCVASLDLIELVMELEEEFDVTISEDEAATIRTVGDAIRLLRKHQPD